MPATLLQDMLVLVQCKTHMPLQRLGALVPARFEIEGALVLQPPPISSHTANLLAIVIRGRIGQRRCGRIDTVAFDAVEKGRVFL